MLGALMPVCVRKGGAQAHVGKEALELRHRGDAAQAGRPRGVEMKVAAHAEPSGHVARRDPQGADGAAHHRRQREELRVARPGKDQGRRSEGTWGSAWSYEEV